MKTTRWIMLLVLGLACLPAGSFADEDLGEREPAYRRFRKDNLQEAFHEAVKMHEAGHAPAQAVREAEEAYVQAQMLYEAALEREHQAQSSPTFLLHAPVTELKTPASTLGVISELLREQLGGKANFVLKDGAGAMEVPALELRGVDLLTLLNVLTESIPDLTARVSIGSQMVRLEDIVGTQVVVQPGVMMSMAALAEGTRVDSITVVFGDSRSVLTPVKVETFVQYVGDLLDSTEDFKDIHTSIQMVLEMAPEPGIPEIRIRFHEDTRLLVMVGPEPQLRLANEVLEQIRRRRKDLATRKRIEPTAAAMEDLKAVERVRREGMRETVRERDEEGQPLDPVVIGE